MQSAGVLVTLRISTKVTRPSPARLAAARHAGGAAARKADRRLAGAAWLTTWPAAQVPDARPPPAVAFSCPKGLTGQRRDVQLSRVFIDGPFRRI